MRPTTRRSQFVYLLTGQLTKRDSLRDIVENMDVQLHRLYHLGSKRLPHSTLSRMNNTQSYKLYEALFFRLLAQCEKSQQKHKFRFKNKLFSLDASSIDLCLSVFPWAEFRQTKGAIKLHVGLDHDGFLPKFITVTNGKTVDSRWEAELFFKWIKQNLKIKSFLGESKNAVMTKIWVAICAYLIVNYIKLQSKITKTMRQVLRLLSLNAFEKMMLFELVIGRPIKPPNIDERQLILLEIFTQTAGRVNFEFIQHLALQVAGAHGAQKPEFTRPLSSGTGLPDTLTSGRVYTQ